MSEPAAFNPSRDSAPTALAHAPPSQSQSAAPLSGEPAETARHASAVDPAPFFERLQQVASSPASSLALLIIDINGFHSINQAHGFLVGDRFLDMVGRRLANRLRAEDLVTRLGADEFAVLLADVFDSASAVAAARDMLRALGDPFQLNDRPHAVSAHVGISLSPTHGRDVRTLLYAARA